MVKYSYQQARPLINTFGYLNCLDKITINPKTWLWHMIGHTARVYVDKETGIKYVYESTTLNGGFSGVQIHLLSEWLAARKNTQVLYRECHFFDDLDQAHAEVLYKQHILDHRGRPYPDLTQRKWRWHLVNAALDLGIKKLENKDQDDVMHCTHLSADLDRDCGIIVKTENPAEWEPDDCRPGGKLDTVKTDKVFIGGEFEIYYGT